MALLWFAFQRLTGVHRDTICRLLVEAGNSCDDLLDAKMRNLHPRYLQLDEIWTYVQKKNRRVLQFERLQRISRSRGWSRRNYSMKSSRDPSN
jgi:hypothetical protein